MILKYIILGILAVAIVYILSIVQMTAWLKVMLKVIDQFLNKKYKENEKEKK